MLDTRRAIGNSYAGNSVTYANGVFTIGGPGDQLWYNSDSFQFAYRTLTGDGSVVARITNVQNMRYWTRFGVMIREGPTPTAAYAFMGMSGPNSGPSSALDFQWRAATAQGTNAAAAGAQVGTPYWVKLTRVGNTFAAYGSANGVDWAQLGSSQTIPMGATAFAGLAVSSLDGANVTTVAFDSVNVGPTAAGGDFSLAVDSQSINAGERANFTTSVAGSGGFSRSVSFNVDGLPDNSNANFSPRTVAGSGTTTMTVNTAPPVTPGTYALTVTGSSPPLSRTAETTLTIAPGVSSSPSSVSMTPSSGAGSTQSFAFVASDPNGATNIGWMQVLFNASFDTTNACYLHYDRASNTIFLRDDTDPSWTGSATLGSAVTLQNSQCSLNAASSSVATNGNNLTVNLALSFKPAFSGIKGAYLMANSDPLNSGWQQMGTWTVPIPAGAFPPGWTSNAIGNSYSGNSAAYSAGVYTVSGPGDQIWGNSDSFQFVSQPLTGDVTVLARITGVQNMRYYSAFGVMIREGPTPTAANAFMGINGPNSTPDFQWRSATGQGTTNATGPQVGFPYWVKLVRTGNLISGYGSHDGITWTLFGTPQTIPMGTTVYAGLAVVSNETNQTTTATFDNVLASNVPDFYLTAAPQSWTTSTAGGTQSYAVGVNAVNGFTGTVTVSIAGLPSGAYSIVNPPMVATGGTTTITITTPPNTAPGSYPFTIAAFSGSLSHNTRGTLTITQSTTGNVPAGWTSAAIGHVYAGSGSSFANGVFTVSSPGDELWYSTDSFQFVYLPLQGDGSITARITGVQNMRYWTRFGVMIREGATPTASYALMDISGPNNTVNYQWRPGTAQGTNAAASGPLVGVPYWVRVTRAGNIFTAFASPDGRTWSQIGSAQSIPMGTTAYAGLAVAALDTPQQVTTVTFDNVTVTSGAPPDFSLSISPASATAEQGSSAALTATITGSGGFNTATSFAVTGLPAGATYAFNPPTVVGNGNSTLTISASGSTPTGSNLLTITATSGTLSHSSTVTLLVNTPSGGLPSQPAPSAISVSPSSGSATTQTFSFVTSHPQGVANILAVQALFNATQSGDNGCLIYYDNPNGTLYLKDDSNPQWVGSAIPGQAVILENGKCQLDAAGSSAIAAGNNLTVNLALTFKSTFRGSNGVYLIADSFDGLSSGWQQVGTWTLAGGSAPDFTFTATPATGTAPVGGNASFTVTAAPLNSFSSDVTLSVQGLPTGATPAFNPASLTGASGSSTLTVAVSGSVAPGSYPLTIQGTANGITHSAGVILQVTVNNSFGISASPASQVVSQTGSTSFVVTVTPVGTFSSAVALSTQGLPAGMTPIFAPPSVTGGSGTSTLTVSSTVNAPSGTYPFTIVGTSGSVTNSFPATLIVGSGSGDFTISLAPSSQTVNAGSTNTVSVTVSGTGGFNRDVSFAVAGMPSGMTATFAPPTVTGSGTSAITISPAASVTPGTYTLTVNATSGSLTRSAPLTLNVAAASGDFTLAIPSEPIDVNPGGSASVPATISAQNGFRGVVNFGVSGLPDGTSSNFAPPTVTNSGLSTLTLTTPPATPAGTYGITVNGTSGTLTHSTLGTLVVISPNGQAPSADSVTPNSGSGSSQLFGFGVMDAAGTTNITWIEALFNSTLDGNNACYAHYDRATNLLYLRDDTELQWTASAPLGTTGTIENHQCQINTGASSATVSGNTITLNLQINFKAVFAGTQSIYMLADSGALNSGWTVAGSWTATAPAGTLPSGWTSSAIGNTYSGSATTYSSGTYTVAGPGDQIWTNSDSFQFAYQALTGDGSIVARVAAIQNQRSNSSFGLMIREGPTPTAAHAFAVLYGTNAYFNWRPGTGQGSFSTSGPGISLPYWLKLTRTGNAFTASGSVNGTSWTQIGSTQTIPMGATAYAGLAVASGETSQVTTVTYDNVSITPVSALPTPNFTLSAITSTQSVDPGSSATFGLGISATGGFSGSVGFSAAGLPSGATPSFNPPSVISSGTTTFTVTTDATVKAGTYNLVVTASSGSISKTASVTLTVNDITVPAGTISSIAPATGRAGELTVVTITGLNTSFVQSQTQVKLGAGVTVGGAMGTAHNSFGPVTVVNSTTLTANVFVNRTATLGKRTIDVKTGASTASLADGFTVTQGLPVITFIDPTPFVFTNTSPVTVRGSVSDPQATIAINGIAAANTGGAFLATVPLVEGNNTLTAVARSSTGLTGSASLQVTLDTTPPRIAVNTPVTESTTTASSVVVSGLINDIVVGTVNDQQATVTVNGASATVSNRSFVLPNVALNLGANAIQVIGRDRSGNSVTQSITVTRVAPSQPEIRVVSGNNQTGQVSTQLSQPIVVTMVDAAGTPQPSRPVTFKVTQNNGSLSASNPVSQFTSGGITQSVVVTTDATGKATVQWTLGTYAGSGNQRVEASASGYTGTAAFIASATAGAAAKILPDTGFNQTGAVGTPLPEPFVVVATDANHNRLANVPVTFTVTQGGGSFGGLATVAQNSDSDGRALVVLTLGPTEGIENNQVEATVAGNIGRPAVFRASSKRPGDPAQTRISGVVLDNSNQPIQGVTMRLFLPYQGQANNTPVPAGVSVRTDAQGQFVIQPAPVGKVRLMADGGTAQRAGSWPTLEFDLVTVAGQNNTIGMPIYLLPLDTVNKLCVTATTGGTLILPQVPGFALTVMPGSVTFPGGTKTGCVSVTPVHIDKVPMVPAFGQQPRFVVTIQPVGASFNPPAAMTVPNVDGAKPRQVTELFSYDHDLSSFVSIGTGTVSEDGLVVKSDPGVGVLKAGWHGAGVPPEDPPQQPTGGGESISLDLSPLESNISPNDTIEIVAYGSPMDGGYYTWQFVAGGPSDDPSAFVFLSQPTCDGQSQCSALIKPIRPGFTNLEAQFHPAQGPSPRRTSRLRSISGTISKVWSDQFPGEPVANYLPGGAGQIGNTFGYILMAITSALEARGKAQVTVAPDTQEARDHLLVRFTSGNQPIGTGSIVGNTASFTRNLSLVTTTQDYGVALGPDKNGDGTLQETEVAVTSPYKFKIVPRVPYFSSYVYLLGGSEIGGFLYNAPIAGSFLLSFLTGIAPPEAEETVSSVTTAELSHSVGLHFSTTTSGSLPLYSFIRDSTLAKTTLASEPFVRTIRAALVSHGDDVRAEFNAPSNAGTMSISFGPWTVNSRIDFADAGFNLFYTYGAAFLTCRMRVNVGRGTANPMSLAVTSVSLENCFIDDLYDWDYQVDPKSAEVQAGFGTIGLLRAGGVFRVKVSLNGPLIPLSPLLQVVF